MINTQITGNSGKLYTITEDLAAGDRPNANLYICEDQAGNKFVAKHFYNGATQPVVGYSIYNHYGRRRDGSETVFYEIQTKAQEHNFLTKFYDRINHHGKWIIIIEHVPGELLYDFILNNHEINPQLVEKAIISFAEEIKTWHENGYAHGDPHLENAIVQPEEGIVRVKLIDYSLLHHRDFYYCQQFKCFESYDRIGEDLRNNSRMGKGFLKGLEDLEKTLNIGNRLSTTFLDHYKLRSSTETL